MTETCILTDGSQLIRDRVGSDWPMRSRQADFGQFCVTLEKCGFMTEIRNTD